MTYHKGDGVILDYLNFGTFREIEPNIMEMIIDDGVELDRAKLTIVAAGLYEKFRKDPYAILANRQNDYFHTNSSKEVYANLKNLKCMANLIIDDNSYSEELSGKPLEGIARTFQHRDEAISWLKETLGQA
jgi:hypothetical protein